MTKEKQPEPEPPFFVGSYISSSHGKCGARNDGAIEVHADKWNEIQTEEDTNDFISLFKTANHLEQRNRGQH